MTFVIGIGFLGVLTLVLTTLIIVANKKLAVSEDPRIDQVEELLPGVNCGACGQAGCRAFAEALVKNVAKPGECTVSNAQAKQRIAQFLGVDVGETTKRVARLACNGGNKKPVMPRRSLAVAAKPAVGVAWDMAIVNEPVNSTPFT